jgi:FkbM family methyltransferase
MAGFTRGYDNEFVVQLYRIFFDREPDPEGLALYVDDLNGGRPPHEIVATFLHSDEYTAKHGERLPLVGLGASGREVDPIDRRLARLEWLSHGGKAVHLGNGRVLTKVSIGSWNLGYLVEAEDLLLTPHLIIDGYHELDLTNYFIKNIRPRDHCIDVGANYGYFTCIMARWAATGKTIALEPNRKVFELLRDNIYINSLEGCASARNSAGADTAGTVTLHRRLARSGNTSIAKISDEELSSMGEPASVAFEVASLPLDALLPEFGGRVDYLKIDVEGAEPLVFRGARTLIANNTHVKIVSEWSPGQIQHAGFDIAEFTADLDALGLTAAVIATNTLEPVTWTQLLTLPYCAGILLTSSTTSNY